MTKKFMKSWFSKDLLLYDFMTWIDIFIISFPNVML